MMSYIGLRPVDNAFPIPRSPTLVQFPLQFLFIPAMIPHIRLQPKCSQIQYQVHILIEIAIKPLYYSILASAILEKQQKQWMAGEQNMCGFRRKA